MRAKCWLLLQRFIILFNLGLRNAPLLSQMKLLFWNLSGNVDYLDRLHSSVVRGVSSRCNGHRPLHTFSFFHLTSLIVSLHDGGRCPPPSRRHLVAVVLFSCRVVLAQRRARARGRRLRLPGNRARDHAGEILRSMVTERRR